MKEELQKMTCKLDKVWPIFQESFTQEFLRTYDDQAKLLSKKEYALEYIIDSDKVLGFVSWWKFDQFAFVEHIGITKACRGNGLGSKVIEKMIREHDLLVLEVEPPNTDIDKKRIEFYKRCGMVENEFPYLQPPLQPNMPWMPLILFTNRPLTIEECQTVKAKLYEEVYQVN